VGQYSRKIEEPKFIDTKTYKVINQRAVPVSIFLYKNIKYLEAAFWNSEDLHKKQIKFNKQNCFIMYIQEMVDKKVLEKDVILPITRKKEGKIEDIISVLQIEKIDDLNEIKMRMLAGECAIFMEGSNSAYVLDISASVTRNIEEPTNEQVITGSHEGFVEQIEKNIHLIRKRIESPNVVVKYVKVGEASGVKTAIIYMKNLSNPDLVEEVERRLRSIKADMIETPGNIIEYIEDNPYSLFPQIINTEKPDRVASQLMEGRVTILMEGTASALILPVTFFVFYQSPDDYNSRFYVGSFLRLIRVISFIVAITLPALYIATVSYHFEVIPEELLYTVKTSLEYVPFPPLIEALLMVTILELLKEAAVRLPAPIAQTIGVVGGLVLGQAVVQASLVSNMMIIVIALTAIASFVVPSNEMSVTLRILSFPIMLGASVLGYLGIVIVLMFTLMHLCKLEAFGTPYFAPFAPFKAKDIKDTIIRIPIWKMNTRPLDPHPKYLKQSSSTREWKKK